jgi:hypothetical protein
MSQNVTFDTDTDKLETVTHIVNKLIQEVDGGVPVQYARTQTLEQLQALNGDDALDRFDGDDFDSIINDSDRFTTGQDTFGQLTITHVRTVGPRPDWLELPGAEDNSSINDNIDVEDLATKGSVGEDDFSDIACLTNHQPAALKEAGFETYRDLYEATENALTDVPGVTGAIADELKAEASQHIDPVTEIARAAYKDEVAEHRNGGDGVADTHLVTDVKIPAGAPRDPAKYSDTNEPWHVFGLPVLENSTVTASIMKSIAEGEDTLDTFILSLSDLIAYDVQADAFAEAIRNTFDSLEELSDAVSDSVDEDIIEPLLTQEGITETALSETLESNMDIDVDQLGPRDVANEIDKDLEGNAPVKARLALVDAMEREFEHDDDITNLQEDKTLSDLVGVSDTPIEIDHPFIEDLDDFPTLKTRTLETGERDIEACARIIAKNNYGLDLVGHAGVGKDTLIRVIAALTNRPTIVINMDESMISQDLMGIHKIDENGRVIFKDGVIPHCAKYGYQLCISEVNAAAPEILTAFHQLLERNAKLHVKERDEVIVPSRKFRISTTRNPPSQEYSGAKELNGAFKRRINSIKLGYLDTEDEVDLIDDIVNTDRVVIDRVDIQVLVNVANDFRESANQTFEFPRISTSKIMHIIDLYDGADDLMGATKESIRADLGPRNEEEACMNAIEDHF